MKLNKKSLLLSTLIVGVLAPGAFAASSQGPMAETTPVVTPVVAPVTSTVDPIKEGLKAKSEALKGNVYYSSTIANLSMNADNSYSSNETQKINSLVKVIKASNLKQMSKQKSSNNQSLVYKNLLDKAAKAAAKEEEESKDPIVTPEEKQEEAVTTTWEFDAATGKYVEYDANGVATGNTKDCEDNFNKVNKKIQWYVDGKEVCVEDLTTKTITIGDTEVTVYLREDGSIYAIADDENTIKWKDTDVNLKTQVEGALFRLQLEESTNYKEYEYNGKKYRVYMNDNGDYTNFVIMADGEIDKVMSWDGFTDEQKAEVLSHLNGKGESSSEEVKLNEYQIKSDWATFTIYYDNEGNISKVGRTFEDGSSDVLLWDEMNETDQNHWTEELNNYLHPSKEEESSEEVKLNDVTLEGWNGFNFKIYYDDNNQIVKTINYRSDGAVFEYSWDEIPDGLKVNFTELLQQYLNGEISSIEQGESSSEESSESSEEQVKVNKILLYVGEQGEDYIAYYDDNKQITKLEIVYNGTVWGERTWDEMDEGSQQYWTNKLIEELGPSGSEEKGEASEEEQPEASEELHTYTFSENGFDFTISYDNNGVIVDGAMTDGAMSMIWDEMGETEKEYLAEKLNSYLNPSIPEESFEEPSIEETQEKVTIDLRPYLIAIETNTNKKQRLTNELTRLENQLTQLSQMQEQAMMRGDEDSVCDLEEQLNSVREDYSDIEQQIQECENNILNAQLEIEYKHNDGDRYENDGYIVEYLETIEGVADEQ